MAISQNFPNTRPSLNLNFARSKTLDPRITFIRTQTGSEASYVDESGIIRYASADEPRFDHDPETGRCLGLMIEEQQTNVIQVSAPSPSDISQASTSEGWRARNNLNLEYSSVTSPDGTNNAVGVAYTSAYTTYQVPFIYGDQGTLTSNTFYTLSYWVDDSELVESNNFHLSTIIGTNGWGSIGRYFIVNYNKTSDTFGSPAYSTGASVTAENANTIFTDISGTVSHYPNNWKRISISFKLDSSYDGYYDSGNTTPDLRFNYGIYMGVAGYTNDNVGNSMKTWGWQLEADKDASSYIPTSGGTKTRNADNVWMDDISDFFNPSQGTSVIKFSFRYDGVHNDPHRDLFAFRDHTTGELMGVRGNSNNSQFFFTGYNALFDDSDSSGVGDFSWLNPTTTRNLQHTIAVSYASTYFRMYRNDETSFYSINTNYGIGKAITDEYIPHRTPSTGITTSNFTSLGFGHNGTVTNNDKINCNIESFAYYPSEVGVDNIKTFTRDQ